MTFDKLKRQMKMVGLIWLPIAILLLPVVIVGVLQWAYVTKAPIADTIAENCYHNFPFIKTVWDTKLIPVFFPDDGIGFQDILAITVLCLWIWACINVGSFWGLLERFQRLRREVEDERIKSEIKNG